MPVAEGFYLSFIYFLLPISNIISFLFIFLFYPIFISFFSSYFLTVLTLKFSTVLGLRKLLVVDGFYLFS